MIGVDNAIAWAHWQIRGGVRRILTTAGIVAAIFIGVMLLSIRLSSPEPVASILRTWVVILLFIQYGLLMFFGAARINGAVKLEISSKMLESNRLMPIHPLAAVGAYLIGPTCGVIAVGAALFVLGGIAASESNLPVDAWFIANLAVCWTVLLIWIVSVFASFMNKGGRGLLVFTPFTFILMNPVLAILFPQLGLIGAPFFTVIAAMGKGVATITWPFVVGCCIQMTMAVIFYLGAARKYERSDVPALGTVLSTCLLALFCITSVVSFNNIENMTHPMGGRIGDTTVGIGQLLATTLLFGMMIALLPVTNAAAAWTRRWVDSAFAGTAQPSHIVAPAVTILVSLLVFLPSLAGFKPALSRDQVVIVFSTITLALLAISYFARFLGAMLMRKMGLWIVIFLIIFWMMPLFVDLSIYAAGDSGRNAYVPTLIFAYSPIGTMIESLNNKTLQSQQFIAPLCFQALVLLGAAASFYSMFSRNHRRLTDTRVVDARPLPAA